MTPSGIRRSPKKLAGLDLPHPVHVKDAPDRMIPVTSPFSGMKWQESRSSVFVFDVICSLEVKSGENDGVVETAGMKWAFAS